MSPKSGSSLDLQFKWCGLVKGGRSLTHCLLGDSVCRRRTQALSVHVEELELVRATAVCWALSSFP